MELAFAGLHQLCGPMLDRLARLPVPQRQALEMVFGLSSGAAPDRFLVGLAVLSLMSEVAEERPVLCVVDDAQWLDQASALTLAFVARRLQAEPVGDRVRRPRARRRSFAASARAGGHGLHDGDARALLRSAVRSSWTSGSATGSSPRPGKPAGAAGTAARVDADGAGRRVRAPRARDALSGRIEESFVRRLEALPDDARRLLLLAAAEPVGDPLLLWRAAERLGIDAAAAEGRKPGCWRSASGCGSAIRSSRSAVYHRRRRRSRRAVHLALAEATDRDVDPDRRAWHLAAPRRDPTRRSPRARALGRAGAGARRAGRRGGVPAARGRADGGPARRAERALAAAQASLQAGAFDAALAAAGDGRGRAAGRAPARPGRSCCAPRSRSHRARQRRAAAAARAAQRIEPLDPGLARETYLEALARAMFAGALGRRRAACATASRAARAAPRRDARRALDVLLDGWAALFADGCAAATPTLQRARRRSRTTSPPRTTSRWGWWRPRRPSSGTTRAGTSPRGTSSSRASRRARELPLALNVAALPSSSAASSSGGGS